MKATRPGDPVVAKVSVLDVVPVWRGGSATAALRASVDLAVRVEALGYTRFWAAEHHNTPSLAASAPAVMAAQLATATSTMRIGSGGVLLPNHPPLVVAEQFGMLSAFHPGRVDLGVGRAAGTDPATATALRRVGHRTGEEFAAQIAELAGYFAGARSGPIDAGAAREHHPPIWLLGSSPSSAAVAARLGLRYAYAHHVNPAATQESLHLYRDTFQASAHLAEPTSLVSAVVIAADFDAEAERIARPYLLAKIQMRGTARFDAFPTQQEADAYTFSRQERELTQAFADRQIIGGPDTVGQKAADLVAASGAGELMALTITPEHADRVASYRLLAEVVGVPAPVLSPQSTPTAFTG
ncbi:LLM class flavin-dependent oxidoreductase [Fodinicola feengrottensis]|uniref:LLM class flavin-dependent oxidoreductase n=1 Tax=Fodinicola feengrottensis TaxID=435914 RepID=UPI0031DCEFE6